MSEPINLAERRAASMAKLKTLVTSRTETLALFSELASKRPFRSDPMVHEVLQEFCEALVDYTASAHFQLYRYFEEGRERRQAVLQVAEELYPRIAETTERIIEFNDKYDADSPGESFDSLADDLSRLGEILADRINLEDRVIAALGQNR
jgi:regulator of sigma D